MSEYQYYEWQTIDRTLTREEQAAVGKLSSHIEVTPSSAVVTYSWSDFKHDPKRVLVKYFDAFYYAANWGSLSLMFRFPRASLDKSAIAPYLVKECISLEPIASSEVLELSFDEEEGGDWLEPERDLSGLIPLRDNLVEGDFRLLYLAWLKAAQSGALYDYDEDKDYQNLLEPPVPPGLQQLTPALKHFIDLCKIDNYLVEAAAEASLSLRPRPEVDYRSLVAALPRAECDEFLTQLAAGETGVALALRKRLIAHLPDKSSLQQVSQRTFEEIAKRAAQRKEAEVHRHTEEVRKQHVEAMKRLAPREEQVWEKVEKLLATGKTASIYDQATELLVTLGQLAEYQGTSAVFASRVGRLAENYASRPSLMRRWRDKQWI